MIEPWRLEQIVSFLAYRFQKSSEERSALLTLESSAHHLLWLKKLFSGTFHEVSQRFMKGKNVVSEANYRREHDMTHGKRRYAAIGPHGRHKAM